MGYCARMATSVYQQGVSTGTWLCVLLATSALEESRLPVPLRSTSLLQERTTACPVPKATPALRKGPRPLLSARLASTVLRGLPLRPPVIQGPIMSWRGCGYLPTALSATLASTAPQAPPPLRTAMRATTVRYQRAVPLRTSARLATTAPLAPTTLFNATPAATAPQRVSAR